MATFGSPRVQITEVDLSEFVTNLPTSTGVLIVRSKRGGFDPVFVGNTRKFKEMFCRDRRLIDDDVIELYAGEMFLETGSSGLWVERAVNSATTGAVMVVNTSTSTAPTTAISGGLAINSDKSDYVYPDWATLTTGTETPLFMIYSKSPGTVGNGYRFTIDNIDSTNKTFKLYIEELLPDNSVWVVFSGMVSLIPGAKDGYGNSIYIEEVFSRNTDIGVRVNSAKNTNMPPAITSPVSLSGGSDAVVTVGDMGDEVQKFRNTELYRVDLFIQGGVGDDTWRTELVNVAETRGDAIALIDVDADLVDTAGIVNWRKTGLTIGSSFGAIFAPWIKIYDFDKDRQVFVPPSGIVGGMMSKTDAEFAPWWVPAGLKRGVVKALGLKKYYDLAERDQLDAVQVNAFARRVGVFALWNNRTMQTFESAFSFIETRRLINYIKVNTCRMLEGYVFEPLVDFTRLQIVSALDEFLRVIKQRFGLYDYLVKSDPLGTGNNPFNNVDQGLLTVELFLKPVRAIRGIDLKLVVTRTGARFEEIVV